MVGKHDDASGKNPHAAALGALGASKGGIARAEKLSPDRRSEIASKAAVARWRRDGAAPIKATHAGKLRIGDIELDCANVPDGRRVISESTTMRALGRGYSGYYSQRDAAADASAVLPRYLAPAALRPYIPKDLMDLLSKPIAYVPPGGRGVAKGIQAEALPKICRVWLEARSAGRLNKAQQQTAKKAEILSFGFAEVGIIALVDEATGYQAERARDELQAILAAYISRELLPWTQRFPDEFFRQIYRLHGWEFKPGTLRGPRYVGKLINKLIYEPLPPGVLDELRRRNPPNERGYRKHKHHQFLTPDIGEPHLNKQVIEVTTLARVSDDKDAFFAMFRRAFPKRGDQLSLLPPPTPKG